MSNKEADFLLASDAYKAAVKDFEALKAIEYPGSPVLARAEDELEVLRAASLAATLAYVNTIPRTWVAGLLADGTIPHRLRLDGE